MGFSRNRKDKRGKYLLDLDEFQADGRLHAVDRYIDDVYIAACRNASGALLSQ